MYYKYTDKTGKVKYLNCANQNVAAQHLAKTEYKLEKVTIAEAVKLGKDNTEITEIAPPLPKAKKAPAPAATPK